MKTLEDWKDAYYEQQALHTESNGMLCQERDAYRKRAEEAEGALAGLADCINTELRENGPHGDQIENYLGDMRPYVRRLVDRVNARSSTYAEGLREALLGLFRNEAGTDSRGQEFDVDICPECQAGLIGTGKLEEHRPGCKVGAALDARPSRQGGECAGLAPPAGCRWPKTCGAQLAEAAVREEGEGPLREIAHRHAREAVAPIGSLAAEKRHDPVVAQNILRQEEIIFYALKEAQRTSLLEGA